MGLGSFRAPRNIAICCYKTLGQGPGRGPFFMEAQPAGWAAEWVEERAKIWLEGRAVHMLENLRDPLLNGVWIECRKGFQSNWLPHPPSIRQTSVPMPPHALTYGCRSPVYGRFLSTDSFSLHSLRVKSVSNKLQVSRWSPMPSWCSTGTYVTHWLTYMAERLTYDA